jgi:hypothetical protein
MVSAEAAASGTAFLSLTYDFIIQLSSSIISPEIYAQLASSFTVNIRSFDLGYV